MGYGAAIAGIIQGITGSILSANAQGQKLRRITSAEGNWLPNEAGSTANYFSELQGYSPLAASLANTIGKANADTALGIREHELPGYTSGLQKQFAAYNDLAQGNLPPSVLANFQRAGGASTVGLGFGGSGFGALNTGLFGARGSLGAMQQGQSLLSALFSGMPQFQTPTAMTFLGNLVTPEQAITNQLQVRNQNVGLEGIAAGVPYGGNVIGAQLSGMGGMATGAGLQAMFSPNTNTGGGSPGGLQGQMGPQ